MRKIPLWAELAAVLLSAPVATIAVAAPNDAMTLTLTGPIATWDEALPLGNGLIGGLLWGGDGTLRLSLEQLDEGTGSRCEPVSKAVFRPVLAGETFVVRGTILAQLVDRPSGTTSDLVNFGATFFTVAHDHTLRNVTAQPILIRVAPGQGRLCGASGG